MLIGEPTRFLISDDYEWVPKPDGPYVLLEHADYLELVGKLDTERADAAALGAKLATERDEQEKRAILAESRLDTALDAVGRANEALSADNSEKEKLIALAADLEEKVNFIAPAVELLTDENKRLSSRLDTLVKAAEADIANAKAGCGGDGEGCEAFRGYYESAERRHRKCGQCPMDATQTTRAALSAIVVERQLP